MHDLHKNYNGDLIMAVIVLVLEQAHAGPQAF